MKDKTHNHILFLLYSAVYNGMMVLATGSIIQSFMLESGIGEGEVFMSPCFRSPR